MSVFLEVDHVDKIFPLAGGGQYIALKNIDLSVKKGEFVSLVGHSGCGKSTLLLAVSGLERPTSGGIILEGREVKGPGPDRMMVFQNYSLLPWLTVRQNIALAVNKVFSELSAADRKDIVEQHVDMVGLRPAADKKPKELSGGMKQRVAIARALSIRPKMMLLDEPFGALDALTRGGLQERLMQICEETGMTCLMVTHDVDEAMILSDRIVLMTNGPEARIGQILDINIPRPRKRMEVVNHPTYYSLRNEIIYFLDQQKREKKRKGKQVAAAPIAKNGLEKVNLEIGFVPLTDCAPLVVAQEMGFFAKHGLEQVTLTREPSWKSIMEGMTTKRLDAAQMVAGMPLAMTLGVGLDAPIPIVTALIMSRNGNAVTLGRQFLEKGVRSLADLKAVLAQTPDSIPTLGVVHPTSMQSLLLRYWLASGGINPDTDVNLVAIPPAQMVSNLMAGNIDGFCAGDPWNSRAVQEGHGYVVTTSMDTWSGHPEKILGVREDWAAAYPETHNALVKAILEACEYCDDRRNRGDILTLLAKPDYIGTNIDYIRPGFIDPYNFGKDDPPQSLLRYNQFYVDQSNSPSRSEALWILTQLARWGITPFPRNWVEVVERTRRLDLYGRATRELELPDNEPNRTSFSLFDGIVFDPDAPLAYLDSLAIKHPIKVEEIILDAQVAVAR